MPGGSDTTQYIPFDHSIELYHNNLSLCSCKVRVALFEKNVRWKSFHIDLIETGKYGTLNINYLNINPGARVPTLIHNGTPIYESKNIIEYIDTQLPVNIPSKQSQFIPNDPTLVEIMKEWVDRGSLNFEGSVPTDKDFESSAGNCIPILTSLIFASMIQNVNYSKIFYGLLFHPYKQRPIRFLKMKFYKINFFKDLNTQKMIKKAQIYLFKHLQLLNQHLKKQSSTNNNNNNKNNNKWICGNKFTLADITWMPLLHRLFAAKIGYIFINDKCNAFVYKYWKLLQNRQSYQDAIIQFENQTPNIKHGNEIIDKWLNDKQNDWFADLITPKNFQN